jgi:hypothetical protein
MVYLAVAYVNTVLGASQARGMGTPSRKCLRHQAPQKASVHLPQLVSTAKGSPGCR